MPGAGRGKGRRAAVVLAAVLIAGGAGLAAARHRLFPGTLARGTAAYDRGDWDAAAALAAARLKEAPGDREAVRLLARTAARRQRDDSARSLYARLGGAEKMGAEDFFLLGNVIDRAGDRQTALVCWTSGLRADPGHGGLLDAFARVDLRAGKLDRAAGVAAALARRPGWEARGDLLLGRVALERGDPAAAAAALNRALDRDPAVRDDGDPAVRPRLLLARAWLGAGKPDLARAALRALPATESDPEAAWLAGRAHLQAGDGPGPAAPAAAAYRAEHPLEPEPAPYVGAAGCAGCHRDIYQAQQNSRHSQTYRRVAGPADPPFPLPAAPLPDPARPAVRHTIAADAGRVAYAAEADGATVRAVVDYVFGSGHHGRTLVGHDGANQIRELRLSHYADGPAWDVTTGHPQLPPAAEGYLGRVLASDDLAMCFDCHTTLARAAREDKGPEAADRAIGCERCHGPGGNHLRAVAMKSADPAIAQPRLAPAAQVVALCAQCHSPFKAEASRADPVSVRFPASTLTWSRCYTESGGALDCRTCHDPHRDAETDPASYESKCLACHAPGRAKATTAGAGAACPVNPARDCVSCHMPKAEIDVPHTSFTDHHIRVHPPKGQGKGKAVARGGGAAGPQ